MLEKERQSNRQEKERERQTDRQTERERETDRQTDRQTDTQTETETEIEGKREENLLCRIRSFDSFACEAKYHRSCAKWYFQKCYHWQRRNEAAKKDQM